MLHTGFKKVTTTRLRPLASLLCIALLLTAAVAPSTATTTPTPPTDAPGTIASSSSPKLTDGLTTTTPKLSADPSDPTFQTRWQNTSFRGSGGSDPLGTTVAIADSTVYAGTRANSTIGYLTRYTHSGTPEWSLQTADERVPNGLAATADSVVYGSDANPPGGFRVRAPEDGTLTGQAATTDITTDSALVTDGQTTRAYSVGANPDGDITVRARSLDGSSTQLWNATGVNTFYLPTVSATTDHVGVAVADRLTIYHANGTLAHTLDVAGVEYQDVTLDAERGLAYVTERADSETDIVAYSLDTGQEQWRETGAFTDQYADTLAYAPGPDALVGVTFNGTVRTFDAASREQTGQTDLAPDGTVSAATVGRIDGTVSVAYATDASNGGTPTVGVLSTGLTAGDVTGTVRTTEGTRVANATVQVWGVNYSALESEYDVSTLADKQEKANALLADARNSTPDAFDPSLAPTDDVFAGADSDAEYVAVHSRQDWGVNSPLAAPDLTEPLVRVPAETPVRVSLWRPGEQSFVEDGVDRDLPGQTTDGTAVFEQLDGANGTVDTTRVSLDGTYSVGGPLSLSEHAYAELSLPTGYYRVHPEGENATAYVIVAGNPDSLPEQIEADARTAAGDVTKQAQQVDEHMQSGVFVRRTVRADSEGRFGVALPDHVDTVAVQAYHSSVLADVQTPTVETLRDELAAARSGQIESATQTPTVYLSTSPERYDVPRSDVTVEVASLSAPTYGNVSALSAELERLRAELRNATLSNLTAPSVVAERINTTTTESLRAVYGDLASVVRAYPPALETYQDVADRDSVPSADELSRDELRAELAHLEQALYQTHPTDTPDIDTPDPEYNSGDGDGDGTDDTQTVTLAWPFGDVDLSDSDASVSVLAHHANGTTSVVDEEYVTTETSLVGADRVVLEEYPIADGDTITRFSVRVGTPDSYAERSSRVRNPAFDGPVPAVDALDFSTLRPGPDEQVRFTVRPADDTDVAGGEAGFRRVANVSVFAPDGATVETTNTTGRPEFAFRTAGEGVYHLRLTLESTEGETFVETVRVRAGDSDTPDRPVMYAVDSTVGVYAVVGSGLSGGSVDASGESVRLEAVARDDGSALRTHGVDVHLESLSLPSDATLQYTSAYANESAVDGQYMGVSVHTRAVSEDAVVYRGDDEPVTADGETRFGRVYARENGTTIGTFTGTDGAVSVRVVNAPSFSERVEHQLRVWVSGLDVAV